MPNFSLVCTYAKPPPTCRQIEPSKVTKRVQFTSRGSRVERQRTLVEKVNGKLDATDPVLVCVGACIFVFYSP